MKISIFKDVFEKNTNYDLSFNDYFNKIKDGYWEEKVLNYRVTKDKKLKELIPAVTPSGLFPEGKKNHQIKQHSGVICMDYDTKENGDLISKRDELYADPYLYAGHISVGGSGLALYFKVNKNKHNQTFAALDKYLANKYNIIADPSCKNIARLRFVSHDPDIHVNNTCQKWVKFEEKQNTQLIRSNNFQ